MRDAGEATSSIFLGLVETLERDQDELCEGVLIALGEDGRRSSPRLKSIGGRLREIVHGELLSRLRCLRSGSLPEQCPPFVADLARLAAGEGAPTLARRSQQLTHMTLWEAWLDAVQGCKELNAEQRGELLGQGSRILFACSSLYGEHFEEAYGRAVQQASGGGEQRRLRTVKEFLDGNQRAASWLGLQLELHHIGMVAWGKEPEAAARESAAELGRQLFSVAAPAVSGVGCCWAWASSSKPLAREEWNLLRSFESAGGRVAFGLEAFGEAGFRSSHRQAIRARRFASPDKSGAVRYADVAIEALTCENEDDARSFVAHELCGIDDDSVTSVRLRETLNTYFACEGNASSAAAKLGIHQQTVANRLRTAENLLGHRSIGSRRIELETALRLRRCLAGD